MADLICEVGIQVNEVEKFARRIVLEDDGTFWLEVSRPWCTNCARCRRRKEWAERNGIFLRRKDFLGNPSDFGLLSPGLVIQDGMSRQEIGEGVRLLLQLQLGIGSGITVELLKVYE